MALTMLMIERLLEEALVLKLGVRRMAQSGTALSLGSAEDG